MIPTSPLHFETYMRVVRAAGSIGANLPPNLPGFMLTREQLEQVNRAYEETYNERRARMLRGRAR